MIFDTSSPPPQPLPFQESQLESPTFRNSDNNSIDENVAWAAANHSSLQREGSSEIESLLEQLLDDDPNRIETVPLRIWIQTQGNQDFSGLNLNSEAMHDGMAVTLRKLTVAYAIGTLLQHHKKDYSSLSMVDNYYVKIDSSAESGWEVVGLDVVSLSLSVGLASCPTKYSFTDVFAADEGDMGRNVEVRIESNIVEADRSRFEGGMHGTCEVSEQEESNLCYAFGTIMHFLFSGEFNEGKTNDSNYVSQDEQRHSKSNTMPSHRGKSEEEGSNGVYDTSFLPLRVYGYPSAICQLVQSLLDCNPDSITDDSTISCPSPDIALKDIHLLLGDPFTFLSEPTATNVIQTNDKFYGRTQESKDLTDAFCRVSLNGRSEAFMIGGYSGYVSIGVVYIKYCIFSLVHVYVFISQMWQD